MSFFVEVIFVGLYSAFIFTLVSQLFQQNYKYNVLILFIVGFLKHYLGYVLGIQTYYCNHGKKCVNIRKTLPDTIFKASNKYLLETSLAEGGWFTLMGLFFMNKNNSERKNIAILFFIGSITHILAEFSGIHEMFCKTNCNKKDLNKVI
jgi:hypothetical protein